MLTIFDGLRDVTLAAIALRLILSVLCGGAIGMERAYKRRPAGFRTHILTCLGASMTTLTSQYLYLEMHNYTDMARLGAQVIAGIGFIGAGTIIVTRGQRVKGLTTAAGLWASAIVGLALGAGFYEGGLLTTAMILTAELLFSRLEVRILEHVPEINLYMEYRDRLCQERVLKLFRDQNIKISNMQITRTGKNKNYSAAAIFTLRLHKGCTVSQLKQDLLSIEGMVSIEEL